ncbi:complex I NDUFA9 subunit family protein [Gimibacter soli]|uniref:Complex I NDUFA9 subunit family protein n=1 Tax=Gimibacter soli TaxID=3024400 RepID=A0AAF0BHP9_9PROT|nr:complex I NDUFA9 subunit family protein [Gimibacter soli]WCL54493.1 complex I NDUFA9 subunit family protein [Gimibacter soli]
MNRQKSVTVFGGSGFIGRYLVERLAEAGWRVRVAVRHPNAALYLKTLGDVGQIDLVAANVTRPALVARELAGADAAVNLVGILYESGHQRFEGVQADAPGIIARAAAEAGTKAFVHVSAIGANDHSPSSYARTKWRGEQEALAAFPNATILRPSLVIGPEDGFFNRFARMARMLPFLPLPGLGTRFQPVVVTDVAAAITAVLDRGLKGDAAVAGKTFELGGPEVMTMRTMLTHMMEETGLYRPLIPVPMGLARLQALFLERLPTPPLTRDQLKLLAVDNVVAKGAAGFAALGIEPQPIASILPRYMTQYRAMGQFG